ncbi:unnamed protein product [Calypogeia fissa]
MSRVFMILKSGNESQDEAQDLDVQPRVWKSSQFKLSHLIYSTCLLHHATMEKPQQFGMQPTQVPFLPVLELR